MAKLVDAQLSRKALVFAFCCPYFRKNPMAKVDTSNFVYKDMFGRDIKVGDYIVYAGLADRSAVMRAGRVIELTYSKEKVRIRDWKTGEWIYDNAPKIRCESWNNYRSQGWNGEEKSGKQKAVSLGFLDRLVVVPEEYVSEKIKKDLDGPVESYW